ncbi:MAG: hypothetical protein WDA74_11540 [Spirochaetota bacterium]
MALPLLIYKGRLKMLKNRMLHIIIFFFMVVACGKVFSQSLQFLDEPVEEEHPKSSSINFDGRMLAGLNGDSIFSVSMTQGLRNFAYQLNSSMVYANDFSGYDNTSFSANETGFTGELNIFEAWKIIPEFEIGNSSYGMGVNNPDYTREKKDKIRVRLKTEYKPAPARWDFDVNFGRFEHRLTDAATLEEGKKTFYSSNAIFALEYIWSASNKVGMKHEVSYYDYGEKKYASDINTCSEFYGSFKVTEFAMISIAPVISWDRDGTNILYFKGNVSTIGFKYFSFEFLYNYILEPYRPDDYLYSQKYIELDFNLPPSTINHVELSGEFDFRLSGESSSVFSLRSFSIKSRGIFENNNNLYNYDSSPEKLLFVDPVSAAFFNSKTEIVTKASLYNHIMGLQLGYDYFKYYTFGNNSDINITYRPANILSLSLSFESSRVEVVWKNSFKDAVYIDPLSDKKMGEMIEGEVNFNFRVYDTFFLYSRINNLYDAKYTLREGYPEPGRSFFFGLRVMI